MRSGAYILCYARSVRILFPGHDDYVVVPNHIYIVCDVVYSHIAVADYI